jgi:hypothetical protein
MQTRLSRIACALSLAVFAGCSDQLEVTNPNVVDVDAAFQTPGGIIGVIGKSFQGLFLGQYANLNSLTPQSMNLSGESSASVANAGMGLRTGIPRQIIDNQLGNQTFDGNNRDYSFMTRFARQAANGIKALGALNQPEVATAKPRALGYFVIGYAQGNIALMYDSVALIRPDTVDETRFVGAATAMQNALVMLDSAIAVVNSPAYGTQTITGPELINATTLSKDRFLQVLRSYKARFRAGVARTPAERALVDWAAVEADAALGITADLTVGMDRTIGWNIDGTILQLAVFGGWHQMSPLYTGMADTTGAYNTYIGVGSFSTARTGFLIQTPDNRWPKGATRAAQQAFQAPTVPAAGVYFRNRPTGEDVLDNGSPWNNSNYDHFRFRPISDANGVGTWILMPFREISMLRAEALIRLGRVADAIPLINASRTANNLPAIPANATLTTQVPGGTAAAPVIGSPACVPRVPVSATTTACGNVLEAMKWEKRMETAFVGYAQWFIDGRGWGDLVPGTPIEWPVPIQEMNSRLKTAYNGSRVQAATNTYFF